MDNISLENEYLTASINLSGAELVSVKDNNDGTEYMWQADPEVWGRHAPVLFPFVGKLKDDQFTYEDKEFHMTQHGFARDMKFEVAEQSGNFVSLVLKSSAETLAKYPFEFEFYINYTLDKRSILVNYQVINPSDKTLYFSVGAHPGFTLPLGEDLKYSDYYFELSPDIERYRIPLDYSNIKPAEHYSTKENNIPINRELFKDDALIFELEGANTISIKSDKSTRGVDISSDNAEFVGLWSTYPTDGQFVCIEPWWGTADKVDASGKFEEKFAIKHLDNQNDEFNANYTITFRA
ncbi:aldose 1-epimerase [Companilactobacillus sp. RD055328]|uniref:aldose 1-epimerase family protein n=1 Tax=Companilactobacillus sp. RD055328 TaxID=2916634 RepID=UPI001FC8CF3D|nr:aldose 1-epimerase family protein [Companilactobacillus sp. RD055328]GKQ42714.1 aldose 1-epimerase [Companilactobacillus sp. RD055328]